MATYVDEDASMTQGIPRRASLNETHADMTSAVPGPQSGRAAEATASASAGGMIEIHPALPKVNPNLVFGATMALWRPSRFTPQELLDTINELLDGTGTVAEFDEKMNMGGKTTPSSACCSAASRVRPAPYCGSTGFSPWSAVTTILPLSVRRSRTVSTRRSGVKVSSG